MKIVYIKLWVVVICQALSRAVKRTARTQVSFCARKNPCHREIFWILVLWHAAKEKEKTFETSCVIARVIPWFFVFVVNKTATKIFFQTSGSSESNNTFWEMDHTKRQGLMLVLALSISLCSLADGACVQEENGGPVHCCDQREHGGSLQCCSGRNSRHGGLRS